MGLETKRSIRCRAIIGPSGPVVEYSITPDNDLIIQGKDIISRGYDEISRGLELIKVLHMSLPCAPLI